MSPIERKFHKAYGKVLLKLAEEDIKAAMALHRLGDIRPEIVIFHAEQAIEKSLKGVLCWKELPVPLLHEISLLLQKLPPDDLPPGGYELHDLTPYATIKRYEEGVIELSQAEIQDILLKTRKVIDWAKKKVEG